MSIGLKFVVKSRSSLLSDCTKGLVGGFKTKLEESDEDKEGARERDLSSGSTGGNLGSNKKGEKSRGGDVASHSCLSEPYSPEFAPKILPSLAEL